MGNITGSGNNDQGTIRSNDIIEAITYPFYIVDAINGRIIKSNNAAKAKNINEGMEYDRINSGRIFIEISRDKSPLQQVINTKNHVNMEYAESDGECFDLYGYPVFDGNGNVVQVIEYLIDITGWKRSQEELVKLSQVARQSLNIVMITDKEGIIEYVNPKFTEITGYSSEEAIGKKIYFLGDPTEDEKEGIRNALNTNGEWRGEFHNRKKNGEYYWEYSSIYVIKNSQGRVTNYIKDAVNISKRIQAEEDLRAAKEKAEQANRFKSEFIANMSHEIRTPLNSILGFMELLLMTGLDAQQKDYLDTMKASSKVLLGMIDDILDFSKIESGKLEIDKTKFYLKQELELVNMFAARAREKKIELLYFIDPSLPEYIHGDPQRLKQVLNNLLSNAVKFTPENGKIFVEIKLMERTENFCRILFSVSDNGIGIPEEKQKKIFDSFFQAESGVSRKYGGSGLGLAISSQLVKLMGSDLKVESRPGSGSRFFFELVFEENNGLDIYRRDYDFGNVTCYLLNRCDEDKIPLYNVERYLKAFNIAAINVSGVEDIIKSGSGDIIFLNYFPAGHDKIEGILSILPDMPMILIANRMDKELISSMRRSVTKVIYKPLYASKIIGDIIDILNNENEKEYTWPDDGNRASFSAEALVAEDNQINQKLIQLMLKEIGVNADLADNGKEALEKFRNKKYDVVLMDVNMPVMNGFEATAGILELEQSENRVHTPIIALTANTVKEDRELLLNVGMNDYLTKPVGLSKLYGALYPYLKNKCDDRGIKSKQNDSLQLTGDNYDLTGAAAELGLSGEFLQKLVSRFLTDFHDNLLSISRSVKDLDFNSICSESHKLKGTAANLRIKKLAEYFSELELNARNKNIIDYDAMLDLINKEFTSFKKSFFHETGD